METKETIPTAEEFFRKKIIGNSEPFPVTLWTVNINAETGMRWAHEYAILFARHHVKEALTAAAEKASCFLDHNDNPHVSKGSILNAYPEEKIK